MNLSPLDQTLQLVTWSVALIELILALYVLLLNARHTANRHLSAFLLIFSATGFAQGLIIGARDVSQAAVATYITAAVAPASSPGLLLLCGVLLKPQWLHGRWRRVWWLVYGLIFLPFVLTLLDVGLGTRLWFIGLDAETYSGGFVSLFDYAAGSLSLPLRIVNFYAVSLVTLIPLLRLALFDKEVTPLNRRLAWLLLMTQVMAIISQMGLRHLLGSNASTLAVNSVFAFTWCYAAFRQMISERRLQRGGRLETRLAVLILVITVPVLIAVVIFISFNSRSLVEQAIVQQQEFDISRVQLLFRQVTWPALAIGVTMLLTLSWFTIRQAFQPIDALTDAVAAISAGDLTRAAPVESEDEIGTLARNFNSMTEQVRELVGGLEERVAERTAELERRAAQLQAVADLSHVTTSMMDLDELLHQAVDLVNERFNLYHTSLFLLDETGRWAEYRAGAGEVGRLIEAQRLRLEIGGASMTGWCTAYAQPRIAQDVNQEALHQAHTLLPDTRSEAVLPLIARGRVIGALDAQSSKIDAFSPGNVTLLRTVADQIAIAIDNVRLLTEVQESLAEAQAVHRHYLQEAWSAFTTARPSVIGYRFAAGEVKPDAEAWLPAMVDMQDQRRPAIVSASDGAATLSVPITLRGETVGLLGLKKDDGGEWTDEEVAVAQTVVDQVALSLENQRLFDEARRLAQHETLMRELSEKMRRTNDRNTILETAVQMLGQSLGSARAFVRLDVPSAESD
jgi:GAF domain-containing protein/HAMP domain-containing protein